MLTNNIFNELLEFFRPVLDFFKDIWADIQSFFLQYVSEDVFNILVFGIVVAMVLIIVLAVINRK